MNLVLKCLSYDFVGTTMDESAEDVGTIQARHRATAPPRDRATAPPRHRATPRHATALPRHRATTASLRNIAPPP